jgi:membrane protease YdiL (CAAX protease family)
MDTPVTFACVECGASITFPAARQGHVETCPHCGEYVDVPGRPSPGASPAEPGTAEKESTIDAGSSWPSDGYLWLEVFAVLCLAVLPDLFSAVAAFVVPRGRGIPLVYGQVHLIVRSLQVSVPLLLILKLNKEPWRRFGIVRFSWFADVAYGVAIWLCMLVAEYAVIVLVPPSVLTSIPGAEGLGWVKPAGYPYGLLLLVGSLANGFAEEFVMRGYLLTRLEHLLGSTRLAVLASTLLFAGYHVYQGAGGVIMAAAVGLVLAIVFCLQRRLWPICIAHAIADFLGILLA